MPALQAQQGSAVSYQQAIESFHKRGNGLFHAIYTISPGSYSEPKSSSTKLPHPYHFRTFNRSKFSKMFARFFRFFLNNRCNSETKSKQAKQKQPGTKILFLRTIKNKKIRQGTLIFNGSKKYRREICCKFSDFLQTLLTAVFSRFVR